MMFTDQERAQLYAELFPGVSTVKPVPTVEDAERAYRELLAAVMAAQ